MAAKEYQAQVRATGDIIRVYHLRNGNWADCKDCNTEYKPAEIEILHEMPKEEAQ